MNQKRRIYGLFFLLALFLLTVSLHWGCTNKKMTPRNPSFEKWRATAQKSRGYTPAHRQRTSRSVESDKKIQQNSVALLTATPSHKLPKKRITLKMHQTNVMILLRALARAVGQNMIISENVSGTISINVTKVPWDQVFLGIIKTQGLFYEYDGEIIRIMTIEDANKDLQKLETESQIKSKKRELAMVDPLITRVVDIDFSNAAHLKGNLESFLSEKSEGQPIGSIMVDEHTNSLIIQAMAGDLERILSVIEQLDRPTPQILIEAHIVEATSETARELGVQWGGLYKGDDGGTWIYPGANSSGVVGNKISEGGIDPTSGYAVNFPASLKDSLGMTIGFAVQEIGESILAAQLSALQEEGKLNILSTPSITTIDNQLALIESGDEVPFQTVEDGEVNIEYKKAVLSLKVTPHVIEGDALKLNILVNKDELDFSRTVAGNPTVITKNAETNVIVFDGQTTVIGGLNKNSDSEAQSGVPVLKDIPLLGYLFKGEADSNRMEDLLIFITPHILEEKVADNPSIPEDSTPADAQQ